MNYGGSNLELAKKLQKYLEEKKGDKGAAISVAIVINGDVVCACAAGVRGTDCTPCDIEDLYNIGSISKVYCATAIMKLVEMGKLELDAPAVKYLPSFKMRDKRYKDITIRMLLNHSSGLPGCNYHNGMSNKWLGDSVTKEYFEYFSNAKLKADPGSYSTYCNDGFEVLASIIEEISGQPYIEFLREYICIPAGLLTTGEKNIAIGDRRMISCIGKTPEWISAIGAGAIRSDISDCARFGYLFIEPKDIIKKEYLDETCKSQGKTFLKYDSVSEKYGLGWDTTQFKSDKVDLGENVLRKDGGTAQFVSELIVSPKYKLSAAISGTNDCEINLLRLLLDMVRIVMKENEIDITIDDDQLQNKTIEAKSISEADIKFISGDWLEKHQGIYYSTDDIIKFEICEDRIVVLRFEGDEQWKKDEWYGELKWNGETFASNKVSVIFEENEGREFFIIKNKKGEYVPLAQKNHKYPSLSNGWQKRIGKTYIVCNLSASDIDVDSGGILKIDRVCKEEVILFMLKEMTIPAVCSGDNDTEMFLNIPENSRDIYAPFAFKEGENEYIRICGDIFIDIDKIEKIKTGRVTSNKKEKNLIFKIEADQILQFDKPKDVTVIIFNEELSVVYTSHDTKPMPKAMNGYIIFANDDSMDFEIQVDN